MANRTSLSLSSKVSILAAVFAAAFVAFGWVVYATIEKIKVNGPIYRQIVDGKDIVADILPPPLYIIESYLHVLSMSDETDAAAINDYVARSAKLKEEFAARQAYWRENLWVPHLRSLVLEDINRPAQEFFDLRDRELIPAVRAGEREKAQALARGPLRAKYLEQRAAVDKLVTAANAYYLEQEIKAKSALSSASLTFAVLAALVIAVVVVMWLWASRTTNRLASRLRVASDAAGRVAAGDLSSSVEGRSNDEAGELLGAIAAMTQSLNSLVARVKKGSIELMSTATQLSASSKEQESSMDAFGSSTTQIVAAVKEISATSDELLHTMEEVTHVASAAAATAQAGSAGLARMDANMGQLSKATASISAKLSSIRERAAEVNVVITTITKVADQTNLLSVNAAIEAEKAGESGRGFLVLAREIRRLADQTAVATLDIERIVKDVQGAVSAGVMEMDKFSQEVRQCTAAVAEIGAQIGSFIGQVQALSDRFTQVADGMRSQSQGARQINDAMVHLAEGARQSNAAVKEVGSAAHSMRDAVDGLKQEIARFKLAG